VPIKKRAAVKAIGPTWAMPWLCATNADPQISATRISKQLALVRDMHSRYVTRISRLGDLNQCTAVFYGPMPINFLQRCNLDSGLDGGTEVGVGQK
jgi:hypothetical protein